MLFHNSKESDNPIYYPHQYNRGTNVKLIEPLNSKLTKGTFVDFKIKANVYDNIIIRIGEYFEREFEKLSDGMFYGESVYIFGNDIKITTLKGSLFITYFHMEHSKIQKWIQNLLFLRLMLNFHQMFYIRLYLIL